MKLFVPCMECQFGPSPVTALSYVDVNSDGLYTATCGEGHTVVAVLQQNLSEILFQHGAWAIIDGYYRDAVSSFASSLERYYEFAIRVLILKAGHDKDAFRMSWKKIAGSSERQLGAFIFLWTSAYGETPATLTEATTKDRNDVIHKGKFPDRGFALRFGNTVLAIIRGLKKRMLEQDLAHVRSAIVEHVQEASALRTDPKKPYGTMCLPTIMSVNQLTDDEDLLTLEQHLDILLKWRQNFAGL